MDGMEVITIHKKAHPHEAPGDLREANQSSAPVSQASLGIDRTYGLEDANARSGMTVVWTWEGKRGVQREGHLLQTLKHDDPSLGHVQRSAMTGC